MCDKLEQKWWQETLEDSLDCRLCEFWVLALCLWAVGNLAPRQRRVAPSLSWCSSSAHRVVFGADLGGGNIQGSGQPPTAGPMTHVVIAGARKFSTWAFWLPFGSRSCG